MHYPLSTFTNLALKALQESISFPNKPSWASQERTSFFYPVPDDHNFSDQPDNVVVGSKITVTIFFCPQVRIENVYVVTFHKYGPTVLRYENGNYSIVEDESYWIKIAESKLVNQVGQVAVTIKYELTGNATDIWTAKPISKPAFTFIPRKLA